MWADWKAKATVGRGAHEMLNVVSFNSVVTKVPGPKLGAIKKKRSIYTLSDLGDSSNLIGSLSRTVTF